MWMLGVTGQGGVRGIEKQEVASRFIKARGPGSDKKSVLISSVRFYCGSKSKEQKS